MDARIYAYLSMAMVAGGIFIGVWTLGRNRPEDSPRLGMRGKKRARAMEAGGIFAQAEPAVRMVAGWVAYFPLTDQRRRIDELLKHAGDWNGLTANEFVALCFISATGMGLFGLVFANLAGLPPILFIVAVAVGGLMPYMQVTGERDRIFKECNRALPGSIDLASLCMGAGLDFPGAIRQIVDKSGNKEDALHEQWETILQELELGRTRRQALENFADRVPTESVRDFTGAVIQSEEKGNPLAEVLRIQATMLRMRRSVMAEEAAARAALLMMGPLMLIFGCIICCLMGPFVIQGMSAEAF
jgi:tight adherence protein C